MPFHDEYARITPYELAFPDRGFAEEHLERIAAAGGGRDSDLSDPERFVAVPVVAETLQAIRDTRRPDGAAGAEGVQKHAILLYHAFHFRRVGSPLYLLETAVARHLVETAGGWGEAREDSGEGAQEGAAPEGALGAPPAPPSRAGYLQLPRNLFWIGSPSEGTPEPVDGLFWSVSGSDRIAVLVAAGIRRERPGFSVLPLPAVPLADAAGWLDADVREGGGDFESELPGGDMERLYSLRTAGEALKLLARAFRYLERNPGAARAEEPAADADAAGPSDLPGRPEAPVEADPAEATGVLPPRPSALPYRRVTMDEAEEE